AGPPARSRTCVGRRAQATPMSSAAAPQNQPGSATARACKVSSDGSPDARRNLASRVASATSGVGRQATPSPSRPKIGIAAEPAGLGPADLDDGVAQL